MKILVIGTRGQIVQCLKERTKIEKDLEFCFVGRPELDLEKFDTISTVLHQQRPDVIINAAAYTAVDLAEDEPEKAFKINGEAPGIIAKVAAELNSKLIQISTDYVFDGKKATPYIEQDTTGPTGIYGLSKLAGEQAVRENIFEHVIIRTAWVYSAFGNNFVKSMLQLAKNHNELSVVSDQRGNPTAALDIADGLIVILDSWYKGRKSGLGETFHLAGTNEASWAEFAEEIFAISKANGGPFAKVNKILSAEYPTKAERPKNSMLDCDKFYNVFGFRTLHWQESLAKSLR